MCEHETTKSGQIVLNRRDLVRGLAAGTVVIAAPGCVTNPETGTSQFLLVSNDQLAALSADAWLEVKKKEKVSNDPALNAQLKRVGARITTAAGHGGESWEYAVFDSDTKNAFVLPGRQVGFYRGLMEIADNDDQIAAVLGHEVGHVTGRHAAERYSQQLAAQGGMSIAGAALGGGNDTALQVLGVGVQYGVLLPYSRRHELEADLLGLDYMARAGYRPSQAITFWQKMASSGGSRPPEILSTHPDPSTRIQKIREHIAAKGYK